MCIDNWLLIGPSVPAVEVLPGALIIANPRERKGCDITVGRLEVR